MSDRRQALQLAQSRQQNVGQGMAERSMSASDAIARAYGMDDLVKAGQRLSRSNADMAKELLREGAGLEGQAFSRKAQAEKELAAQDNQARKDLQARELEARALEQNRGYLEQAADRDTRFNQMMQMARDAKKPDISLGQAGIQVGFSSTRRTGGGSPVQDQRQLIQAQMPKPRRNPLSLFSTGDAPQQRQEYSLPGSTGFGYINQYLGLSDFGTIRGEY